MQVSKPKKGYKFVDAGFGKIEEIPEEWENSNIGKIGTYVNGKAFKPTDWQKTGIPIIRIQNLTDESNEFNYSKDDFDKKYEINDGNILISWSASLGCFKWNRGKAVLNQHIFKAVQNNDVSLEFFYYILSRSIEKMKKMVHGSTMQHITLKPFLETQILLPPFKEQQKIASILTNVDNTLEKTYRLIQKTKLLKKGLMQKLFSKGIGHTKFKKVEWLFGKEIEIPEEWKILSLKDVSKKGLQNGVFKKPSEFGSGISLVNVFNLYSEMKIDLTNLDRVQVSDSELDKYRVYEGDIFFDRSSLVLEGIGHSNIILDMFEPTVFECHVMRLSPNKSILPEFLFYYTKTNLFKQFIVSIAKTVTMTTITQPDLEKARILIPTFPEQKQIMTILSNVDSQITKEKLQKSNLEILKKGLMQKLLTGQIRVKV